MNGFRSLAKAALRAVWLRQGTARRALAGPYRGLVFYMDGLVQNRLEVFFRPYESNVTAWLERAVQPGDTVWIVGAHIGIHALYAARRLRGRGQVVAFEGWPENAAALRRNIALNPDLAGLITTVPVCIARQPGMAQMARGASDGKHHLAEAGAHTVAVEATTLDAFWRSAGRAPDAILIDIEGYELDALEGGAALLAAARPRLALEHHDRAEALRDWLAAHGRTVEQADKRHIFAS